MDRIRKMTNRIKPGQHKVDMNGFITWYEKQDN
jgi:hypothetical protein